MTRFTTCSTSRCLRHWFFLAGILASMSSPGVATIQAGFSARVVSPNPLVWDNYNRAFALFEVRVTNTGTTADAYIVTNVERPSDLTTAGFGWIYSPTPTLPLTPGDSGSFYVRFSGFEQPPPGGPGAGDYTATISIQATVDTIAPSVALQATVRRLIPQDPATGVVQGRVSGSAGEVVNGKVTLGDPSSVRVADLSANVLGGFYSITAPAGRYWLWIDATGYRSKFADSVVITAGQTVTKDLVLASDNVRVGSTTPAGMGDAQLPTYRAAYASDLSRTATLPGFYAPSPNDPPQNLFFFDSSGTRLWGYQLPPVSTLRYDVGEWTSTDGGVDVSPNASLVAVGTSGGTIAVLNSSGALLWQTSRASDRNPKVPGPLGKGLKRSSEVKFSPDGTKLAAGGLTGYVYLFNAQDSMGIWKYTTAGQVRALRFSPDGSRLYVGSGDNKLYALRILDGTEIWRANLLFWPWEYIAITADGQRIATGGKDGVLRVFDANGNLLWSREVPGFIQGYDFSPDGQHLIVLNGATGVYDFAPNGSLRWYRRELMGGGKVFVGTQGKFVGVGFATTGNTPGVRVFELDGTPIWTYHSGPQPNTFYQVRFLEDGSELVTNDRNGKVLIFKNWIKAGVTNVEQSQTEIPTSFSLEQNYPNPFNPSTKIQFALPKVGFVTLKVYDLLGREVAALVSERLSPGMYETVFEASNLPSGVYFYRLQAESFIETKRLILTK